MSSNSTWRSRLAAPAAAAFAVVCCLAAPILAGAAGTLTAGAVVGLAAGAIVLLALCLYAARRLAANRDR
jgi:hypothetical protein